MTMEAGNYYECLQVQPDACPEVIRAVYRALSQRWHPDKLELNHSPQQRAEAEAMMRAINEAYEVLANPRRRKQYDREYGYKRRVRKRKAASVRTSAAAEAETLLQQTSQRRREQVTTCITAETLGGFVTRMWWLFVLFSFPALSICMFVWTIEDWQQTTVYDLIMLLVSSVLHLIYADYAYSCLFRCSLCFFRGKPLSDYEVDPDEQKITRVCASFTLAAVYLYLALWLWLM